MNNNPAEDVSTILNGRTQSGEIALVDWFKMSEEEWEGFAEAHLEPLIDVGASPCPPGLVFRGMLIVPLGTHGQRVYFTCFSEPDWQAGAVIEWDGQNADEPDDVSLTSVAESLPALLGE